MKKYLNSAKNWYLNHKKSLFAGGVSLFPLFAHAGGITDLTTDLVTALGLISPAISSLMAPLLQVALLFIGYKYITRVH